MTKVKKLLSSVLSVVLVAGMFTFTGCGPDVSEEEYAQLQELRSEVNELQKEVSELRSEKTKVERELAEKNAKLEQCAQDKEETRRNLQNMGM